MRVVIDADDVVLRAALLYLPVIAVVALAWRAHPTAARVAAAVVATAWNLAGLLALNVIASGLGWWTFFDADVAVAGVPVEVWIGWTLWWGTVPALATDRPRRLAAIVVGLVAVDLALMGELAPVVVLGDRWLLGEAIAVAACLVPGVVLARWTSSGRRLRWRASGQVAAFTATVGYVLPSVVFEVSGGSWDVLLQRPRWQLIGAVLVLAPAAAAALQAVVEFVVVGHGTPLPLDPPQRLVASGPYAFVANPMQIGGSIVLAGWGVLLGDVAVVVGGVVAVAFSAGIAAVAEDGELTRRFGPDWSRYRSAVRLWVPCWRPPAMPTATVYVASGCRPCVEVGSFLADRRPGALTIAAAQSARQPLSRLTYRSADVTADGLAGIGRALEHAHLGWAVLSWIVRLPLLSPALQLISDAVGGGPRLVEPHGAGTLTGCTSATPPPTTGRRSGRSSAG